MTVDLFIGDCRDVLASLPAGIAHCCVTSPPYYGLRNYEGGPREIGREISPTEFVEKLVAVFREVRRVLRDDGTLWVVIGDSYAGSGRGGNPTIASSTLQGGHATQQAAMVGREKARGSILCAGKHERVRSTGGIGRAWVPAPEGLKDKDLIGIPWMLAFALRADGWYLRRDNIWDKPNPMPESVKDRCTTAHEYVFHLSKSDRYYYDAEAIAEVSIWGLDSGRADVDQGGFVGKGKAGSGKGQAAFRAIKETRNKRSIWRVATQPYAGAHFASYPPALIEPCILAASPKGGLVLDPFGGAGTTGLVAERLGRNAILIELNPLYAADASRRIEDEARLTSRVAVIA